MKHTARKRQKLWDRFDSFTPRSTVVGSTMAEIELNVLMGQCLNRRIDSLEKVRGEAHAWEKERNNKNAKINWQFMSENARIRLKRLYPTFDD